MDVAINVAIFRSIPWAKLALIRVDFMRPTDGNACQAQHTPVALLLIWFNLIPAWISNYMPGKVWGEITYPFLNFNGYTVEV